MFALICSVLESENDHQSHIMRAFYRAATRRIVLLGGRHRELAESHFRPGNFAIHLPLFHNFTQVQDISFMRQSSFDLFFSLSVISLTHCFFLSHP